MIAPVTFTANGRAYTFTPLGTNALVALEQQLGRPFGAILQELGVFGMEALRLGTVRTFLQACVAEAVSEEEIGTLIDAIGFDGISTAINGLIVPAREGAV